MRARGRALDSPFKETPSCKGNASARRDDEFCPAHSHECLAGAVQLLEGTARQPPVSDPGRYRPLDDPGRASEHRAVRRGGCAAALPNPPDGHTDRDLRSEEHTSELQSLLRI